MTTLREADQQALEALDCPGKAKTADEQDAITALRAALADQDRGWYTIDEINAKFDPESAPRRAALAEAVQEPVAWMLTDAQNPRVRFLEWSENPRGYRNNWIKTPLYTSPPQRKPLTDDEIDRITDQQWAANNHKPIYAAHRAYARAIERAHGIK